MRAHEVRRADLLFKLLSLSNVIFHLIADIPYAHGIIEVGLTENKLRSQIIVCDRPWRIY